MPSLKREEAYEKAPPEVKLFYAAFKLLMQMRDQLPQGFKRRKYAKIANNLKKGQYPSVEKIITVMKDFDYQVEITIKAPDTIKNEKGTEEVENPILQQLES